MGTTRGRSIQKTANVAAMTATGKSSKHVLKLQRRTS